MPTPKNQAAWLKEAGASLEVGDAPMPTPGLGQIVVKNSAIAINPLDWHMQEHGVFVQQWPAAFGCDVAGEVHEVGPSVVRFQKGDRVIGHTINLISGLPEDAGYALYTVLQEDKAAILPSSIPFVDGVVVPFALEAAVCALSVNEPGPCMPGVLTPALGLPYPSLQDVPSTGKTLVVYGGSSSAGSMTIQLATAAGIRVIALAGAANLEFVKTCGAVAAFDYKDAHVVEKVVQAIGTTDFVGIFDAISLPETFELDLAVLTKMGGGWLACTHPPPKENVPENVKTGMIFAVNDIAAPVWRNYVTEALEKGKLKCLPPPTVIGKGLKFVNEGLKKSKEGVSATKLVVEL